MYATSQSNLSECTDVKSSRETNELFAKEALKFSNRLSTDSQCLYSCTAITFTTNIQYFHNTTISSRGNDNDLVKNGANDLVKNGANDLVKDGAFVILLFFDSNIIEASKEVLIYDFTAFVAAVGGNLGLFLGFSCAWVSSTIIGLLRDCFLKHSAP